MTDHDSRRRGRFPRGANGRPSAGPESRIRRRRGDESDGSDGRPAKPQGGAKMGGESDEDSAAGGPLAPDLNLSDADIGDDDVRALEVLQVARFVIWSVDDIYELAQDDENEEVDGWVADTFTVCYRVAERLLEHTDAFREDPESVPDDLLELVRMTLVPLGEIFGAEMSMERAELDDGPDTPGAVLGATLRSAREHAETNTGRAA